MHLSMLIWMGGRPGKAQGFVKGSQPMVRTFHYRRVPRVETFEFPLITKAIADWKLQKTLLPVGYQLHYQGDW